VVKYRYNVWLFRHNKQVWQTDRRTKLLYRIPNKLRLVVNERICFIKAAVARGDVFEALCTGWSEKRTPEKQYWCPLFWTNLYKHSYLGLVSYGAFAGLIVSESLRKSSPNVNIFLQNFSLNSIAYIYLLVKFLFCLFFCFFYVYLLPVMVNKDV